MAAGFGLDVTLDILRKHCEVAVVTLGKRGCIVQTRDAGRVECETRPAEVVDTIGAGDFFCAGFLHAHAMNGASVEVAAACGNELAGSVVRVPGTELDGATWAEVQQRVRRPMPPPS